MEEEMLKISMANRFQLRIMPESHGLFWQQKVGEIHYLSLIHI